MPMTLPPAMLMARAGSHHAQNQLEQLVLSIGSVHQAFEDGWDLDQDLAAGRVSWQAQQWGAHCDAAAASGLRLGGGLAELSRALHGPLREISCAANDLDLPELADHASNRPAAMEARIEQLIEALVAVWSSRLPLRV